MASGCAWTPQEMVYPKPGRCLGGMKIIRSDRHTMDLICSHTTDKGKAFGPDDYAAGCYDEDNDTIYLLDNCLGAEALPHELGHREGLADPEKAGLDW